MISDKEYINALEYLIDKGFIQLESLQSSSLSRAAYQSSDIITISPKHNSSTPVCENECYDPTITTASAGSTVMFSNTDDANHSFTSGNPFDGPDGLFDSGLVVSGTSFSHTFNKSGTFDFYCMVHPWMQGVIIVK